MNIGPIKSEADYERTLARIAELMDAKRDTREGDELDVLTTLAEAYEARHFPIEPADPVVRLADQRPAAFVLEQHQALGPKHLTHDVGSETDDERDDEHADDGQAERDHRDQRLNLEVLDQVVGTLELPERPPHPVPKT